MYGWERRSEEVDAMIESRQALIRLLRAFNIRSAFPTGSFTAPTSGVYSVNGKTIKLKDGQVIRSGLSLTVIQK